MEATRPSASGSGLTPEGRISRRRVLEGTLLGGVAALAAAVVYPILRYLSPPNVPEAVTNRVLAGKVSELGQKGWLIFPFGSLPGILIQVAPGDIRAFSAVCTHLQCTVQFDKAVQRIWCACHNGFYDLNGTNVAGPPPRPLTRFNVQVTGDEIFVTRD